MGDTSIESKKSDLIHVTEDPDFQRTVYQYAYKLAGNAPDAESYVQEALARFILEVNNKTSLNELERMRPLPYISTILKGIHANRTR
jgi:DNA-directed RNA polymerase specialized sigma24 family protein